jgi:hypothetical protein
MNEDEDDLFNTGLPEPSETVEMLKGVSQEPKTTDQFNKRRAKNRDVPGRTDHKPVQDPELSTLKHLKLPGDEHIVKVASDSHALSDGINCDAIASEILSLYKVAFERNDKKFFDAVITAASKLTGQPPTFLRDPDLMKAAMDNFMKNARQFNSEVLKKGAGDDKGDHKAPEKVKFADAPSGIGMTNGLSPNDRMLAPEYADSSEKSRITSVWS